jgi:serine protease SohB
MCIHVHTHSHWESQVKFLREEVTAIIGSANVSRGDSVLLILNTGGGTVTG